MFLLGWGCHLLIFEEFSIVDYNMCCHICLLMSLVVKEKNKWTDQQCEYIDWKAMKKATKNLTKSQHTFVSKYIHGWLPTRGHPGYDNFKCVRKTCPLCKQETESNNHFIVCEWKRSENTETLIEKINTIKTNTHIQTLLTDLIRSTANSEVIKISETYKQLESRQRRIGFNQLLMGRYVTNWADEYNSETNTTLGITWIAKIIAIIWEHQQQRWYKGKSLQKKR